MQERPKNKKKGTKNYLLKGHVLLPVPKIETTRGNCGILHWPRFGKVLGWHLALKSHEFRIRVLEKK